VYYASTRGENDPRLTVGDPWEPGIPASGPLYREVATSNGEKALALVDEVKTDSWDAAAPTITGCEGETTDNPFVTQTLGGDRTRCFDGVRNWEQVRPGAVFDGGYAFTTEADKRRPSGPASTSWRSCLRPATSSTRRRTRTSTSATVSRISLRRP